MVNKFFEIRLRAISPDTGKTEEQFDILEASIYVVGAHGELTLWKSKFEVKEDTKLITYSSNRWLDIREVSEVYALEVKNKKAFQDWGNGMGDTGCQK